MIDWTPEEEEAWRALSESSSNVSPAYVPRDTDGTTSEDVGTSADTQQEKGGSA